MGEPKPVEELRKMRLTLTSRSLTRLDEVCNDIVRVAKGLHLWVRGPARAPTKITNIRTRLAPNPGGSNQLYGNFELRVHKKIVDILTSADVVEQIVSGSNMCDVLEIEVRMFNPAGETWEILSLASLKSVASDCGYVDSKVEGTL